MNTQASGLDFANLHIDTVGAASSRTRTVLVALLISSCLQVVALWNFSLSVDSTLRYVQTVGNTDTLLKDGMADSLWVSIPLVDAKFKVSDLQIVGPAWILVILLWLVASARRENHLLFEAYDTMHRLQRTTPELTESAAALTRYMLLGIVSHQLFLTSSAADSPRSPQDDSKEYTARVLRAIWRVMPMAPVLVLTVLLLSDVGLTIVLGVRGFNSHMSLLEYAARYSIGFGLTAYAGVLVRSFDSYCRRSEDTLRAMRALL